LDRLLHFSFWRNVLDILAVWFVFYQILLLIRGTRAFQMVIGVLVFLLVFFVSGWLKLYTLNWLITSFWSQIILALLILFQPEIRKALARVGKSPLLFGIPLGDTPIDSEEIVKALQTLSRRGIGGIIVIERTTDLSEVVEVGVPLDALISSELLVSLFLPYSPIHDGAAIIRKNRIATAGCFLPISLSSELSRQYGTRHRAAIGITEETDAVALVVSEETSQISLVVAGRVTPQTDMVLFRQTLARLFRKESRVPSNRRLTFLRKGLTGTLNAIPGGKYLLRALDPSSRRPRSTP
jgi:diadenylate cyclase